MKVVFVGVQGWSSTRPVRLALQVPDKWEK